MPDKIPGFGGAWRGQSEGRGFFVCVRGVGKKSLSLLRRFLN